MQVHIVPDYSLQGKEFTNWKLDSTGPGEKGVDYKLRWSTGIVVLESQGLEEKEWIMN